MKLGTVFARFYKSFNFDTVRKSMRKAQPKGDWEIFEEQWFPFVEVDIDSQLTTIVGANESGKSHLLTAIEKAITGDDFEPRDLCRYSPVFGVERGGTRWPQLGIGWKDVEPAESAALLRLLGLDRDPVDRFLMFRDNPDTSMIWLPGEDGKWSDHPLNAEQTSELAGQILPLPFRIHATVALPDAIPFHWLTAEATPVLNTTRRERATLLEQAASVTEYIGVDHSSISSHAPQIFSLLKPLAGLNKGPPKTETEQSLRLARTLLLDLAEIEPASIGALAEAIADGQDGYANGLTDKMNGQLERHLNFRKWWVQDSDFELRVTPREHELVFTIRDRTGTEYTFAERSAGLKYFLSYLIQTLSHRPDTKRERILLMDEPDTYLSAEAQQDLMRILRDLAEGQSGQTPVQVIYVTHSPFLIDKNHAERIRVLEKGRGLDGTQVVSNASQNHYEPLRSAFGAFVGETAFVGTVNLLVEGPTDQILIAGAARTIRSQGDVAEASSLDLNHLVIVPCGAASQVPYMVYLIRGRDAEKPPVVALLDSDAAGNEAFQSFKTDKKLKGLIKSDHVLQLGSISFDDAAGPIKEIEDLLPPDLVVAAVNACITEVTEFRSVKKPVFKREHLDAKRGDGVTMFDAVAEALRDLGGHVEKLAFARWVVDICNAPASAENAAAVNIYLQRMRALFQAINVARKGAERDAGQARLSQRVDRQQRLFLRDHKTAATREQASDVLDDILGLLDGTREADAIRTSIQALRRDHQLDDDILTPVTDFPAFAEGLAGLKNALAQERLAANAPPPANEGEQAAPTPPPVAENDDGEEVAP